MKNASMKKNIYALFMAMSVAVTVYAADDSPYRQRHSSDDIPNISGYLSDVNDEMKPIYIAAHTKDVGYTIRILDEKPGMANVSVRVSDRFIMAKHYLWTPLCEAARSGSCEISELLIRHNADVNKCSPIYVAAEHGHLAVLQLLLNNGANADMGELLVKACFRKHCHVMEFVITGPFDISPVYLQRALSSATRYKASRSIAVAKYLLDNGATLNIDIDNESEYNKDIFTDAVCTDDVEIVKCLYPYADPETIDRASPHAYTSQMKTFLKKEKLWRKRRLALCMASDFAEPNLLQAVPEAVARWIIEYL